MSVRFGSRRVRYLGLLSAALLLALLAAVWGPSGGLIAQTDDHLDVDPAHNLPVPCEALSTPGLVPRSAKNIVHVANVCGFVGTDIEFQSRTDASGNVRDYAFVGTMGAGTRIFDITDPAHPVWVGGYADPGWQNDVAVWGDVLVLAFDPISSGSVNMSTCLQQKQLQAGVRNRGGVDVVNLHYDRGTGKFTTTLRGCYLSQVTSGDVGPGAHTVAINPNGDWLAVNTSSVGVEVVDIRGSEPTWVTHLPRSLLGAAHDVSFSGDGHTMYVASPGSGTYIIDVATVLEKQQAQAIQFIDQNSYDLSSGSSNRYNLTTTHQADVSADGRILVYTDERGGGLSETRCNADPKDITDPNDTTDGDGIIGGMYFYAMAPIEGLTATAAASPASPVRLGTWFYPNPLLAVDVLNPVLVELGRTERSCTIHVFRNGGNGSSGPGAGAANMDGVSRLPVRQLVSAHYGAGVWHIDFSGPASSSDGIAEDQYSTWGNALGWNVMPGADTWSAKEYKGYIYAGDMARGFDVYAFGECVDLDCIASPTSSAGRAHGGGQLEGELAEFTILRGTSVGGNAQFGMDVSYSAGGIAPSGSLTFKDRTTGKNVKATSIDSFRVTGNTAVFTGRATVNGAPGVAFFAEVTDGGKPGDHADAFRLVLADGYGAAGVVDKGNLTVEGP